MESDRWCVAIINRNSRHFLTICALSTHLSTEGQLIYSLRPHWEEKEVYDFYLTAEKIEAQRSSVICLRSKSWDLNPSHLRNLTPPSITLLHISPEGPATLGVQRLCFPVITLMLPLLPVYWNSPSPYQKSGLVRFISPLLPASCCKCFWFIMLFVWHPRILCVCVCVWCGGWLWGGRRREAAEWLTTKETGVTRGKELARGPGSGSMPPRYPQSRDTRLKTLMVCHPKELNDIRMRHIYAPQNNIKITIAVTTNGNNNRHN